jgi:hypothetical protein
MTVCSECPRTLTAAQQRRGNVTCGRACGIARANRLTSPAVRARVLDELQATNIQHARLRIVAAILEDLRPHVSADGFVPLRVAAHIAVRFRRQGYHRGWGAAWQRARRRAS